MLDSFYNYSDICNNNIVYKNKADIDTEFESAKYQIILLKIDCKLSEENCEELKKVFESNSKFYNTKIILTRVSQISENRFIILNCYKIESLSYVKKISKKFLVKLQDMIFYSTLPPLITVVGNIYNNINNFNVECSKCINCLKYEIGSVKGKLIYVKNIYKKKEEELDLNKIKLEIKEAILSEREDKIYILINHYLISEYFCEEEIKNLAYNMLLLIQLILGEFGIKQYKIIKKNIVLYKQLKNIENIDELENWVFNIFNETRLYVNKKLNNNTKFIIKEIKQYIKNNYNKKLTVSIIANKMYFSPNYLNSLFKKETGLTIPNYITSVRIDNAKKLLVNTRLKLYEIVEMVGYKHSAYFNSLFEEYVGMTPIKYRRFVENQSIIKNNIH